MHDEVARNHAGSGRIERAEQFDLHDIARRLVVRPAGPPLVTAREALARPPVGIETRQVQRDFKRAGLRFADAVRGHEEALFVARAGGEKLDLLRVELAPAVAFGLEVARDFVAAAARLFSQD